jgi:DNA-binding transcriptional LysR family regulator
VLSPRLAEALALAGLPAEALAGKPLLGTRSRPQAWPDWATAHALAPDALQVADDYEHLLYLLEAAVAGLGIAIAPEPLVQSDLHSGRLIAPWGFIDSPAQWVLCTPARNTDRRTDALADWLMRELRSAA